jgi:hypothetical protein
LSIESFHGIISSAKCPDSIFFLVKKKKKKKKKDKIKYLGDKVIEGHNGSCNVKGGIEGKGDIVGETVISRKGWLGDTFLVVAGRPVTILHDELVVRVERPVVVEVEGDEAEHRKVEVYIPPTIHSRVVILSIRGEETTVNIKSSFRVKKKNVSK